ncbi:MAG: YraN family protein [Deltaproteobacteria bacterium]|nr:YraN family protein [Deltaproteobacteria bacterium]
MAHLVTGYFSFSADETGERHGGASNRGGAVSQERIAPERIAPERIALGKEGEALAAAHLKRLGFKILETNFRCRLGEIDIIAATAGKFLFAEVKTRRSYDFGSPLEAVDQRKQRKIFKVAQFYLMKKKGPDREIRFAVIAVDLSQSRATCEMVEFTNLF